MLTFTPIILIVGTITWWVGCDYYYQKFARLIPVNYRFYKLERTVLSILWPVVILVSIGHLVLSSNSKEIIRTVVEDD